MGSLDSTISRFIEFFEDDECLQKKNKKVVKESVIAFR